MDGPIWPTTRRRSQWWRRLSWWRRGRRHSWCEFSAIRATAFTQHRYATANRWWRLGVQSALHTRALGTRFTTEIEAEIAQLAAGWPDLISLGSGDPDLDTPAHIRAAAAAAIEDGATHYTPHTGLPKLRAAISTYLHSSLGLSYAPDEICVTSGVQEALMVAMLALVGPGDEILCPVPTYSVYLQQAALLGATIVQVPCEPEDDFIMMPHKVEKLITPRTKVLIHMSPNNPTGAGKWHTHRGGEGRGAGGGGGRVRASGLIAGPI